MKLKHSLLTASLLAILAAPTAFAGDDAAGGGSGEGEPLAGRDKGDSQTAIITIPEVSLIDVTNEIQATLEPPKDAGDNFKPVNVGEKSNYDISANIPVDKPESTKKIVATSTNIPVGWQFGIEMKPPSASGASTGKQSLTKSVTSVDLVTGIQNVAQKEIGMAIEIGPEKTDVMPSHTNGAEMKFEIVYTITAG